MDCLLQLALIAQLSFQEVPTDVAPAPGTSTVFHVLPSDGTRREHLFHHEAGFRGTLWIWARSTTLDPVLVVESAEGDVLAANDNSGGGTTACVSLGVTSGQCLVIIVGVETTSAGEVQLHLADAPETDQTLAAAQEAQEALEVVKQLHERGSLDAARQHVGALVEDSLRAPGAEASEAIADSLWSAGFAANSLALLDLTSRAWGATRAHRERTLPPHHPDLQAARQNLASTLFELGDLHSARALFEQVLDVREITLPTDDHNLQATRANLAVTIRALGDLHGARALQEQVLEVSNRNLSPIHRDLQAARLNLANTLFRLGDLNGARALEKQVLEVRERTLPPEHRDLQSARQNYANSLFALGDLHGARELQEQLLEVREITLPADHPDLQAARLNLAATLRALGNLRAAQTLEEQALEIRERTLPPDHPDLQAARLNLAATLFKVGDLRGAQALLKQVLKVFERSLPPEHPDLQAARLNLAATSKALGDLHGARVLEEQVLEVFERTLPPEHPHLHFARGNLAATLGTLGDLHGEQVLEEQMLQVFERSLPPNHPDLQSARGNLAATLFSLGDLHGARVLAKQVLEVRERTLPRNHPDLQAARMNLAWTWVALRDEEQAGKLARDLADGVRDGMRRVVLAYSPREVEEWAREQAGAVSSVLALASGAGLFPPDPMLDGEAFAVIESVRAGAIAGARLVRQYQGSESVATLGARIRQATAALVGAAQQGSGSDLAKARRELDAAQSALTRIVSQRPETSALLTKTAVEALAANLAEDQALVGYWRNTRWELDTKQPWKYKLAEPSLLAFVVAPSGELQRVELGPVADIARAITSWREAIRAPEETRDGPLMAAGGTSVARTGHALRRLVLDPVLAATEHAEHLVVALDDVLHSVPLDALPLEDGAVGERYRIDIRTSLRELLWETQPLPGEDILLAVGGVDYEKAEAVNLKAMAAGAVRGQEAVPIASASSKETGSEAATGHGAAAPLLRSVGSAGLSALPGSGAEVDEIAGLRTDREELRTRKTVLQGAQATREALVTLAPHARWLHLATHGWISEQGLNDSPDPTSPFDLSRQDQIRGLSPMVLCGLALAGANGPPDRYGTLPGTITAEEIATLDLRNCELAVLSACETAQGDIRRGGQGVASLQKALHMAGARSVITSLWKVPDDSTRQLMVDFYRRLWVEGKPKHQALWEAKMALRDEGLPLRHWSGWVLTGEPD